jgi:hypothetical protein
MVAVYDSHPASGRHATDRTKQAIERSLQEPDFSVSRYLIPSPPPTSQCMLPPSPLSIINLVRSMYRLALLVLLLEDLLHLEVELALPLDPLLLHVADYALVHGL